MPPRSVTVTLRTGVGRGILPDGKSMKQGVNYIINYDDFEKISPGARKMIIRVVSLNTTGAARTNRDLTYVATTPPQGIKAGRVERGVSGTDSFMLVKVVDAALVVGDAVTWANLKGRTVTRTRTGGSASTPLMFAGVALTAIPVNSFGWIQISGELNVTNTGLVALTGGDPLALDPANAGQLRVATGTDKVVGTALASGAGASAEIRTAVGKVPYRRFDNRN